MKRVGFAVLAVVISAALAQTVATQSLSYTKGQTVSPAYEGWEQAADGTRYFVFGYMNRNWEEELVIPIGPDNGFSGGGADQGQPTRFLPRRNRFVFRVKVPANFTVKDEMIWTLTSQGKADKAFASLRPDYRIDDVVIASETGALGAGSSSPEVRSNKAPTVTLESPATVTAKVGQPVSLVAVVKDDGIPRGRGAGGRGGRGAAPAGRGETPAASAVPPPTAGATPGATSGATSGATPGAAAAAAGRGPSVPARITVGKTVGLHLSWFVYRGAAATFDPAQIKPWEDTRAGANSPWAPQWVPPQMPADGRIVVKATFSEPGQYVLRALADDGALLGSADLRVTVTP